MRMTDLSYNFSSCSIFGFSLIEVSIAMLFIHIYVFLQSDLARAESRLCVGLDHTCFVKSTKELICWGNNRFGQIGLDTEIAIGDNVNEMVNLGYVSRSAEEVTCGNSFTCFVDTSQKVQCFGININGEAGIGFRSQMQIFNEDPKSTILPASTSTDVSTFNRLACARVESSIYCWGFSTYLPFNEFPTLVNETMGKQATLVTVGGDHACFLDDQGHAYCWGKNAYGQLGASSNITSSTFARKVDLATSFISISAGADHTCVQESKNYDIYCFGSNTYYQLGDLTSINRGTKRSDMLDLAELSHLGFGKVYAGNGVTCTVTTDESKAYCIGDNTNFAICTVASTTPFIGDRVSDYPPNYPINVPLSNSLSVATGIGNHHCITDNIDVYCWGVNLRGQLGIESTDSRLSCSKDEAEGLRKACIYGDCSHLPRSCNSMCLFVGIALTISIPIIVLLCLLSCAFVWMVKRRKEFDAKLYQHPSGINLSGKEIWRSYTKPIDLNSTQHQSIILDSTPVLSPYAIASVVPPPPIEGTINNEHSIIPDA